MRTYLRIDGDSLDEAKAYASKGDAIRAYARTARELSRYGQGCTATLHYARCRAELDEYPDFALELGERGGVRCERA